MPTSEDLDALLDLDIDRVSFFSEVAPEPYEWFDEFLPSLNWWRSLGDLALETSIDEGDFGPDLSLQEQREGLLRLLTEVLLAFVPAQQETSAYSEAWGCGGPATLDLLKRYRLYTRAVEQLVAQVWPELAV